MDVALLRFDAPLMSFGSVVVDQFNKTDLYPYRSMLVGLIANALGWMRRDVDRLNRLQQQLSYAARRDRAGTVLVDFQTVDFSEHGSVASGLGWTFEGVLEERKGGGAGEGTHIRYRHYVADGIVTVAFSLDEKEAPVRLSEIADAMRHPARPLFLGRKCCVPASPVWLRQTRCRTLRDALETEPRVPRRGDDGPLPAIWPRSEESDANAVLWPRVEDRDWNNSLHVGRSIYVERSVDPPPRQQEEAS